MKLDDFDVRLARVEMMALDKLPDVLLSDEDRAAIKAVLDERSWLHGELKVLREQVKPAPAPKPSCRSDWEEAIEQCDRIIGKIRDGLPGEAEEFAGSVLDRTVRIRKWIETNEVVTGKQNEALDNMEAGVDRWLHDE